jgi:ribosomal protein S18 acetylase RimI-like enzyme
MMIFKPQTTIRPAVAGDRPRLANLIHFEVYVHRHLDWRTPLEWIGEPPYLVLEQRKEIVAALACPPDPPEVAWLRLFAVTQPHSIERAFESLWNGALDLLKTMKEVKWAAALCLWPWFARLLEEQGFEQNTRVVMLSWENDPLPAVYEPAGLTIRPMNFDDIPIVQKVDAAAFSAIWQNSHMSLELAYQQAVIATVAEYQGQLVGYQISTPTPIGGHLARLAVLPDCQNLGIGYTLVRDLLIQFKRRGAHKVTVNTQKDNPFSIKLYQKLGFYMTGEEYPVYIYNLE